MLSNRYHPSRELRSTLAGPKVWPKQTGVSDGRTSTTTGESTDETRISRCASGLSMRQAEAERSLAGRRLGSLARQAVAWAGLAATLGAGCGSGDGCAGFISINVSPVRCAELAEDFGCEGFEVDGPSCGLFACARCE